MTRDKVSESILLVDDHAQMRKLAKAFLANTGYQVLEAQSGDAAIRLAEEQRAPIRLLIADVVMPGMNGPELARILRDKRPSLKVLFISGFAQDSATWDLSGGAGTAFLSKPFSPQVFLTKVRDLMEAP